MQIFQKLTYFQKSYLVNPVISSEESFKYLLGSCQALGDRYKFSKNSIFACKLKHSHQQQIQLFSLKDRLPSLKKMFAKYPSE